MVALFVASWTEQKRANALHLYHRQIGQNGHRVISACFHSTRGILTKYPDTGRPIRIGPIAQRTQFPPNAIDARTLDGRKTMLSRGVVVTQYLWPCAAQSNPPKLVHACTHAVFNYCKARHSVCERALHKNTASRFAKNKFFSITSAYTTAAVRLSAECCRARLPEQNKKKTHTQQTKNCLVRIRSIADCTVVPWAGRACVRSCRTCLSVRL